MKRKGLLGAGAVCLIFLAVLAACGIQNREKDPVIGVLVWADGSELSNAEADCLKWMDDILDADVRVMEIFSENDLMEMIDGFCREGGDVLINVDSLDFTEILQICEENQVYLLQMWEMSMDTDIVEKAMSHRYFLGCLLSDDMGAAKEMAGALKESGCRDISTLAYYWANNMSNAQQRRNLCFHEALGPGTPTANLEIYSFDEGIRYLAGLETRIDGLLLSEKIEEYSVQTAKEIMENEKLKFAYFDVNEFTRPDLEEGSLVMVSCGQQNIVQLAVAYACAFVEKGKPEMEKLNLACPYIYITSPEEYDLYQRLCVEEPAYSEEMMCKLMDSLEENTDLLVEYAQSYSLPWLEKQKNS